MMAPYSDAELMKKVRGDRTKEEFSSLSKIARPMLSDYERGAVTPSAETWMKVGNVAPFPLNVECWRRGGMPNYIVQFLHEVGRRYLYPWACDEIAEYLRSHGISPEPVTEPLGDEPVGGEPESLKGPSKTVRQFYGRHGRHLIRISKGTPAKTGSKKPKPQRRKK
jgi:hypothetical protein